MSVKTIRNVNVKNKRVLVRVDFNVPQNDKGEITDTTRIVEALPTINELLNGGARVVLCSHLGRPDGKAVAKYTLKPVADKLGELLGKKILFASDTIGEDAVKKVKVLKSGEILLLENLRYDAREENNDKNFAKALSNLADIFVFDAFGTAHRKHASTYGVIEFLPSYAGFLVEKELKMLGDALNNPRRPFVAVLGGKKVSDKITLINALLDKVNYILIGGAMAFTFIKALDGEVGLSIVDNDNIQTAKEILIKAYDKKVKIVLPKDFICAKTIEQQTELTSFKTGKIENGFAGYDIGNKSQKLFSKYIKKAGTVFWNGPMGAFEREQFAGGTLAVATAMANSKAITVIGGGDSAAAITKFGLQNKINHISTGGGASLTFLEGSSMPTIEMLKKD